MYSDHFQKWFDFSHGLLIFLLLVQIRLVEVVHVWISRAFYGKRIQVLAEVFLCVCWCMQSTSSNDLILVIICSFSYFWPQFDLTKWVIFGVSGHFLENTRMGRNGLKGGVEGHFWRFLSNPVDSVTGFRSFAGTVSSLMPCCFSNNHTGVKRSSVTSTNDFGGAVITPDAFITWLSSSFSAYQNGMHVLVYYDTSVAKVLLRT